MNLGWPGLGAGFLAQQDRLEFGTFSSLEFDLNAGVFLLDDGIDQLEPAALTFAGADCAQRLQGDGTGDEFFDVLEFGREPIAFGYAPLFVLLLEGNSAVLVGDHNRGDLRGIQLGDDFTADTTLAGGLAVLISSRSEQRQGAQHHEYDYSDKKLFSFHES